MRIARLLTIVLAVVLAAWFALGARQAHDLDAASAIISQSGHVTASQAQQAKSFLDAAGTLNPDRAVEVLRAQLAIEQGNSAAARQILYDVVRREPEDLNAWIQLVQASTGSPATFTLAVDRIRQLVRTVPASH